MKRSALMVTIVPLLAIAYIVYGFAHPPWTPLRIAGLVLLIPALLLLTISRIQLGNSFSFAPQASQLVTRGIYSRIRNPIYVFGTISFIGALSLPRAALSALASRAYINPPDQPRPRRSTCPRTAFRRPVPPLQSQNVVLVPWRIANSSLSRHQRRAKSPFIFCLGRQR
jgi:Phospholipid methyltransferase